MWMNGILYEEAASNMRGNDRYVLGQEKQKKDGEDI